MYPLQTCQRHHFESAVQALIDQVASKCESCMDSSSTTRNRSVNPNQGWRWRKQKRRRENPSQNTVPDSEGGPESPVVPKRPSENSGHWHGNNDARTRRRQAARRCFDGPEAQQMAPKICDVTFH